MLAKMVIRMCGDRAVNSYVDPRQSNAMMEIFTRCSICDFHTRVAGSAGSTQSAMILRTAPM